MLAALADLAIHIGTFLFLMGVILIVHEWGHYYAAKIIDVPASDFAIGLGPTIWSRVDSRGCRWQLRLLPLGGYVKFRGGPDEKLPDRQRFDKRSPADRAFVIAAGPALNLLLGMALIASLYALNGRPYVAPVVSSIEAGMPAALAGVLPGDRIVSINGMATEEFADVIEEISLHPNGSIHMEVLREGMQRTFSFEASSAKIDALGREQTVGRIGINAPSEVLYRQVGATEALMIGASDVYKLTRGAFIAIGQIVTGQRAIQEMGGPVRIAEMSGAAFEIDARMFVLLMAVISINLGVMNLLPLPILDGGQLVLCAIEAARGRPIGDKALGYMHQASALFLLLFIVGVTLNDVLNLIARI